MHVEVARINLIMFNMYKTILKIIIFMNVYYRLLHNNNKYTLESRLLTIFDLLNIQFFFFNFNFQFQYQLVIYFIVDR